jgi:hypothetical protein
MIAMLMENNRLPEMTSYVKVIRERQESRNYGRKFDHMIAMMTQEWRGQSYKFMYGFHIRIYIDNRYHEPNASCRFVLCNVEYT